MTLANVWLGPVIISAYSLSVLLICVIISSKHGRLPPRWPYLSEIATRPPEMNVYSMMTNHIALMVVIWVYLKHRELVSYFAMEGRFPKKRMLSLFNMCVGCTAAVALQMSANFPKSQIPYVQTISSLTLLICTVTYIWIHTIFSFFVIDSNIARIRLFLVRVFLASVVTSCMGTMLKVFDAQGHNFDKTTPSPAVTTETSGAIFEWVVYFAVCLFLLTDAHEFRNMEFHAPKLVIPGSPLYDENRLTHSSIHLSLPARRREMSFSDLPAEAMSATLVR